MEKPLWRITIGNCLQQGIDILCESVQKLYALLGEEWDYLICYNGLNRDEVARISHSVRNTPTKFFAQNWATCPIGDYCQSPKRADGSFEWNGTRCGGTIWKVCPPRIRLDSHEIIMDNDIVILKKFPQIEEFLNENKSLVLEEPIRFYGRYDYLFSSHGPFLNSGLMGFPPGYDFGAKIHENWIKYGQYQKLTQADEQGLLTFTLNQSPNIRIQANQMIEILHRDFKTEITGDEQALHFTQANRIDNHRAWQKYQDVMEAKNICGIF